MKAMHTEGFYKDNWERLIARTNSPHYFNFEAELEEAAKPLKGILPEGMLMAAKKALAGNVLAEGMKIIREDMRMIKDLESGRSSLGYTTARQEISARHELRGRFEFNCLQARYFREKRGYKEASGGVREDALYNCLCSSCPDLTIEKSVDHLHRSVGVNIGDPWYSNAWPSELIWTHLEGKHARRRKNGGRKGAQP